MRTHGLQLVALVTVIADGGRRVRTYPLFDVERTAIKELDNRIAGIIAKKLAGVVVKEVAAAGVQKATKSEVAGAVTSLLLHLTDSADLRSWSTLPAPLPTQRAGAPAVAMDGRLVVLGGESPAQVPGHGEVEAYDPATQRWSTLPPLPRGRHGTQATMLDGVLHVAAGSGDRGGGPELDDHLTFGATRASRND